MTENENNNVNEKIESNLIFSIFLNVLIKNLFYHFKVVTRDENEEVIDQLKDLNSVKIIKKVCLSILYF
jgi:hypothetical protein